MGYFKSKSERHQRMEQSLRERYREPAIGGKWQGALSWQAMVAAVVVMSLGVVALTFMTQPETAAKARKWTQKAVGPTFPDSIPAAKTPRQQQFVALVRQEYKSQPSGTKYSRGVQEPWCADFVSWVRKEIGVPLKNPHSGSWRIPGVWTLQDYARQSGTFHPAGTSYQPKVGDALIWGPKSKWGRHVNFVLDVRDGSVVTIGGNESNMIQVNRATPEGDRGFRGYVSLPTS